MTNKVAEKIPNPQPAIGQVWSKMPGVECVVAGDHVPAETFADPTWCCIGVETPAGRVMVGERRQPTGGSATTILAIVDDGMVRVDVGEYQARWLAEHVASWPLVPTEAQPTMHAEFTIVGSTSVSFKEYKAFCDRLISLSLIGESFILPPSATVEFHNPREERRRAIDVILREDARKHPAFADARRAAALALCEHCAAVSPAHARTMLTGIHEYETQRGGMRKPSADAVSFAAKWCDVDAERVAFATYERMRGNVKDRVTSAIDRSVPSGTRERAIRKAFATDESIGAAFVARDRCEP